MKNKGGVSQLELACRRGASQLLLEKYIRSCRPSNEEAESPSSKKAPPHQDRFPNLAGFCRFARVTPEELEALSDRYPQEIRSLYATLEDEALNSTLPAAILSVYLKKRLGYEESHADASSSPIQICFEHDVLRDGE